MQALEQTIASLGDPLWIQRLADTSEPEAVVARWRHGSARVQIPTSDAVRVILSLSSGQHVVHSERNMAASAQGFPGHISVFPAGILTDTAINGDADVVQMFIKPITLVANRSNAFPSAPLFELRSESLKRAAIALFVAIEQGDRSKRDAEAIKLREIVDKLLNSNDTREREANRFSSFPHERVERVVNEAINTANALAPRVEDLAAAAQLSVGHFIRSTHRAIGTTPHQFLILRRNERAMDLLRDIDLSVADVADAVGYASVAHFVASFKQRLGVTPGAYQKALQSKRSALLQN